MASINSNLMFHIEEDEGQGRKALEYDFHIDDDEEMSEAHDAGFHAIIDEDDEPGDGHENIFQANIEDEEEICEAYDDGFNANIDEEENEEREDNFHSDINEEELSEGGEISFHATIDEGKIEMERMPSRQVRVVQLARSSRKNVNRSLVCWFHSSYSHLCFRPMLCLHWLQH